MNAQRIEKTGLRHLILIVGIILMLTGLLWIGQGAGWINWPASSFMIAQQQWVYYGAGIAFVGLFLIGFTRRRGD